jgi:hypothetical protein
MDSEIKQMCQQKITTVMLEPIPKVVDSDESFSLCGIRIVDWGVPRCGNLNIAALLSGVVCDIRVT